MLLRHGLKSDAMGSNGISLMGQAIWQAARRGDMEQVRLLLAHHARTDEKFRSKTAWDVAMSFGRLEIARLLEEAGAPVSRLNDVERFVSLCMAGDERGARGMLEGTPHTFGAGSETNGPQGYGNGANRSSQARSGFRFRSQLCRRGGGAALCRKGRDGSASLERGASLCVRDPFYDSTPVGWADFFERIQMRDMLLSEGPICLFDALDFERFDRIPNILRH